MYGLPENINLDFLKDKTLIQICISSHQIIMRFDEDISISIESLIKLLKNNGENYVYDDFTSINKDFLALLGNSIVNVISHEAGTLSLIFGNGSKVELTDDNIKYESYHIVRSGKVVVIV